ncbi:MAG: hypothetical protein CVU46_03150 [Chloroflexi bacterium HGW-Chloroflexi-8]|nr:MAG: hypothetical protein CVU46_03150 [Chloroflexi bacterium HGW-Chloroflexi-8]
MKFIMKRRDFSDLIIPLNLEFVIERYSWSTFGGPKQASITARGDRASLFELVNHLRAPVEILNEKGDCVWWGYIANLTVSWEAIGFGVDLETMYNRVAVAYTIQNQRYTTQWSGDADAIAEYGQKEILLSKSDTTEADALQLRDTSLAGSKYPIPTMQFAGDSSGEARITCLGWLQTLEWEYYLNTAGKESYETSGKGGREIGEDDRPIFAQSLQIAAATAWIATSIWLHVWKQGSSNPTDNLVVSIKEDSGGVPGTTLASGLIAGANIDTSSEWIEFVLSSAVTLEPATTYWIHIARSGSVAESNYFMVDTNLNNGYSRGAPKYWNTNLNIWVDASHKGDLLFKLVGAQETSTQIATLVTTCGQFFDGSIIEILSGIESNPYRDGDSPALYELEKLLSAGTSNSRRLLCVVTRNRKLRVYEETSKPAVTKNSFALNKGGNLLTQFLSLVDPSHCTVGIWCHLQDVIPASVDLSMVADPSLFLIEEAEYDVKSGEYHVLRTAQQSNTMDIGGVIQG